MLPANITVKHYGPQTLCESHGNLSVSSSEVLIFIWFPEALSAQSLQIKREKLMCAFWTFCRMLVSLMFCISWPCSPEHWVHCITQQCRQMLCTKGEKHWSYHLLSIPVASSSISSCDDQRMEDPFKATQNSVNITHAPKAFFLNHKTASSTPLKLTSILAWKSSGTTKQYMPTQASRLL